LEVYRREAEAFVSARDEALYRHYAGLTPDLPLAPLYARHADLFTAEAATALRAEAAEARGDAGRGLRMLAELAAEELPEAAARALRATAGVPLAEPARRDLPRLMRAVAFDPHFPAARLVPALERTLEGMGVELRRQANVVLDVAPRPGKSPRAFCAPVVVP